MSYRCEGHNGGECEYLSRTKFGHRCPSCEKWFYPGKGDNLRQMSEEDASEAEAMFVNMAREINGPRADDTNDVDLIQAMNRRFARTVGRSEQ